MRASACASQRKAEGGTGSPPPPKKRGGRGGGRENSTQPPNRPPTPPEAAEPPTQKAPKTGPPKGHKGIHPAKTGNTKPGTAAHREKGHRNMQTHTTKKKRKSASSPAQKKGERGKGTTRPGTGTPSNRGGLHPARPDWWPPTKRPRATSGGLIAAGVTCSSGREGVPPVLAHVPPFGRDPRR